MSFSDGSFDSPEGDNNTNYFEDYFEFNYRYNKVGSSFGHDGNNEKSVEYQTDVTIAFTWNPDKYIYQVESYASSPTVDYVEVPNDEDLKKDVFKDLSNKRINLDYIPDFNTWDL